MWREWLGDRSQWHSRVPAGSAKAYLAATIFVAIAGLARWGLGFLDDGILPFPTFYPAVFFATVVGGVGAGVFAAALAATLGWGFMAPHFAFFPLSPEQEISLFLYLVSALLLVWGGEHYRTITKRLVDEEGLRQLAVEELSHRLKNKITTLQSIVSFQLREHPHLRNEVTKRLMALSKADGLIMGTAGKGADLRGILSTELGPYELSRMSLEGPDIILSPKPALMMALVTHELATNAAKYGALSSPAGRVSVNWSLSNRMMSIEWRESDGPIVTVPARNGFGLRLLSRAFETCGGSVETDFETSGLICRMKLSLPAPTGEIATTALLDRPAA